MDVLVLIDKLDDLVHNAKQVPLTDQVRVDKEEIYDLLDQMRATIPDEIKQARWIVKERQEMLAEAKREAERIVKEARERQEQLISQEEVTRQAERQAEDIVEDARAREREIRLGAEDYADEILNTLEVNLSKFIGCGAARARAAAGPRRARRSALNAPSPRRPPEAVGSGSTAGTKRKRGRMRIRRALAAAVGALLLAPAGAMGAAPPQGAAMSDNLEYVTRVPEARGITEGKFDRVGNRDVLVITGRSASRPTT
jgi:F0F1-type ATP synthase membrane subunit b/b'